MTTDRFVHIDDRLVSAAEAAVAVDDAAVRHGDAATEPVRIYDGEPFEWDAHCERLFELADQLRIDHDLSPAILHDRITSLCTANECTEGLVRCSITAGTAGTTGFATGTDPTVIITMTPLRRGGQTGPPAYTGPATVHIADRECIPVAAVPAAGRTHNQLDRALAWRERPSTDIDDVLLRNTEGAIVDGCRSTPVLVGESAIYTAQSADRSRRVMHAVVTELAESEGIPVRRRSVFLGDFETAAEAFLVNERWGVRPVGTVGDIQVGRGPLTSLLRRVFEEHIEERYYGTAEPDQARDGDRD
ncbi:MAG: aminotransferase class IV [Halobacteriales archaeon]